MPGHSVGYSYGSPSSPPFVSRTSVSASRSRPPRIGSSIRKDVWPLPSISRTLQGTNWSCQKEGGRKLIEVEQVHLLNHKQDWSLMQSRSEERGAASSNPFGTSHPEHVVQLDTALVGRGLVCGPMYQGDAWQMPPGVESQRG